jgi:putative DNA primase/helicase
VTSALDRLKADRKWVAWKFKSRGKGKPTKPPINPHTGTLANVSDPTTWGSFEEAYVYAQQEGIEGTGYVLTDDDGLTGADLDHCRDPVSGEIQEWAAKIVALNETYCEISPSGTGLRFFWEGKLDAAVKNDKQQVEIYCTGRYLTITGNKVEGCPDEINPAPKTQAALLARAAIKEGKESAAVNGNGGNGHSDEKVETEFDKLNTLALKNLASWVPALFEGKEKSAKDGYRVPSRSLGRDLQEDISLTSIGIVDFGVADQGDPREGKRTPISLVMEQKRWTFDEAVNWLCDQLGVQRPGLVLNPNDPIRSSRALMVNRFLVEDQTPILHRHRGAFWVWKDNCYRNIEDETLRTSIWRFLENVHKLSAKGKVVPYQPKRTNVSDMLDALSAVCQLDPFISVPTWLKTKDMPPATEFLACANGLLHVPSQTLYPPTPDFFGVAASTVAYDETAPEPTGWLRFVDETLGDQEAITALQDWMGYTLTPDTSQQKILFCVGPRRSGKGTLARIHTALLGQDSVSGPTMSSLGENFGLEPLITRPLAIVSDARIGGRTDKSVIVERLLSISGEDSLSVPRKFLSAWNGRLPTRFEIMTNELPSLAEGSGALVGRFIVLVFQQSFYGREDTALTGKLLEELPGILNWAIAGYLRLRERGHFIQPANAQESIDQIEMLGAPVKAFLRDRCEVAPGLTIPVDDLYSKWKSWGSSEGRRDPGTKEWFGRNLHSAIPGLMVVKRDGARAYQGVTLKPEEIEPGSPF